MLLVLNHFFNQARNGIIIKQHLLLGTISWLGLSICTICVLEVTMSTGLNELSECDQIWVNTIIDAHSKASIM